MDSLYSKLLPFGLAMLTACAAPDGALAPANQALETDAAILREALVELYPSLNRYGQRDDVLAALDGMDILASGSPEPMEFYQAVVGVAVATRDEHVIPFPPDAYRTSRREGRMMLPYTVQWIDASPYVAAVADPDLQHLVGNEITAFDGHSAQEVQKILRQTIPSDGLSETFALRRLQDFTPTQNENYFDLNYPIWFGEKGRYSISVKNEEGTVQTVYSDALDWVDFSNFYRSRLPRAAPIQFRWLDESVAYLSINSFHDWYFDEHKLDAQTEFNAIFDDITERPGASLILDLRRNEGGGDISSLLLDHLLNRPFQEYNRVLTRFVGRPAAAQHCENANEVAFDPSWSETSAESLYRLKENFGHLITGASQRAPRSDAFEGRIVVLISGATGSAAVKVASVLDREERAQFVGEETGGAAAGATAFGYCTLILPSSGIKVDIPLVRFEREQPSPEGRGVLPHIVVDAGRTPPIVETDRGLEAARKLLGDVHRITERSNSGALE